MGREVYCICRKGDNGKLMVGCDKCEEWFHHECLGVNKRFINTIKSFVCHECLKKDEKFFILFKNGSKSRKLELPNTTSASTGDSSNSGATSKSPEMLTELSQLNLNQENQDENGNKITNVIKAENNQFEQTGERVKKKRGRRPRQLPMELAVSEKLPTKAPGRSKDKVKASHQRQCLNPDCRHAARSGANSKYCSNRCGLELARIRLDRLFEPAAELYLRGGSKLQDWREDEGQKLMTEREELIQSARDLELEIKRLKLDISKIRFEAQKKMEMERDKDDESMRSDSDNDSDSNEAVEAATSEASKVPCVSCGSSISIATILKHWASCFKRNETMYTYSNNFEHVDAPYREYFTEKLFCDREVRTKDRPVQYCKRLLFICPEHNNTNEEFKFDGDDVCGCPRTISQELVLDGNYCTELKRDCTQHYQWERFRRAHIDIERLQVYQKLHDVTARIAMISENITKQGGGILGIMIHKAIPETSFNEITEDVDMADADDDAN